MGEHRRAAQAPYDTAQAGQVCKQYSSSAGHAAKVIEARSQVRPRQQQDIQRWGGRSMRMGWAISSRREAYLS
jgi:hypothetical protein